MYFTDIVAIVSAVFFQLFPNIRNIWPHPFSFTILHMATPTPWIWPYTNTVYAIAPVRCASAELEMSYGTRNPVDVPCGVCVL